MDKNYELNSKVKNILNVTQTAEVNLRKLKLSSEIRESAQKNLLKLQPTKDFIIEPYANLIKDELDCVIGSDYKESEGVQEENFDPFSPPDYGIDIEESDILDNIKKELKIENFYALEENIAVDNLKSGDTIVKGEVLKCEFVGEKNNTTSPQKLLDREDKLLQTTESATTYHINIVDDTSDQVIREKPQIEEKKDNEREKQSIAEIQSVEEEPFNSNQNLPVSQGIHLGEKSKGKPISGKKTVEATKSASEELPTGLIGMMTKRQVHNKNGMETLGNKTPKQEMKDNCEKFSKILNENIARAMSSTESKLSLFIPKEVKPDISPPKRIVKPKLMTPKIATPGNLMPQIDDSDFMKSCKVCRGVFISVRSMVDHVSVQHEEYFVCDICGSHFERKTTLRNHVSLHFDIHKEFKCKVCDFKTHSNSIYYAHKRKHFGAKVYKCNYCDYTAYYMCNIKHHERCHFARCQLKCPECDYVTPYTSSLTRHLVRHSAVRPYKCDMCPYSSKYPFTLESHKRKHSNVTLYNCEVCHKGFKWSYALTAHMFVHTNAKKFFCNKCDYSSGLLASLRRHEVKHLNAMSCVNCPFTTSNFKNLICHRIRNHKVKNKYVCPLCDFTCKSLRKTLEHKSTHLIKQKKKQNQIKKESNNGANSI